MHPAYAAHACLLPTCSLLPPAACPLLHASLQLEPTSCVTSLTRLTELKLNTNTLLQQASSCTAGRRMQPHKQALGFASARHWFPMRFDCTAAWHRDEQLHHASLQAETDEVDAFVGTIGRRLTSLRRLALYGAQHLGEAAMEHLSGEVWAVGMRRQRCGRHMRLPRRPAAGATHGAGLTALTELCIMNAHDFGGRALEALRPLTSLRRLALSETTLNPAALAAVLDDEEDSGTPLLPALTFLALRSCRLLRWGCSWAAMWSCLAMHLQARLAATDYMRGCNAVAAAP